MYARATTSLEGGLTEIFSQGRYIPVFAAEVYDQNAKLVEAGLTPVNLSSIMIGMCLEI